MHLSYKNIAHVPDLIPQVCRWYRNEWHIEESITANKLSNCGLNVPLQIVVYADEVPVATGGLYNEVNLHNIELRFKKYTPWLALLYTIPDFRGKGIGSFLCDCLEIEATKLGIRECYLFTSSAESLYVRKGWKEMERIVHKERRIVVMNKIVGRNR